MEETFMTDRDQQLRDRAYKIWEDEGRPEGSHEDHWQRAQDEHALTEQESEDVTETNQQADDPVALSKGKPKPATGKQ